MSTILTEKLELMEKAGIPNEIITRIETHVRDTDHAGLIKISPYRMADDWKLPRQDVLEAFLYGTRFGIFDLVWDIRCPSCRGATTTAKHLELLKPESHCDYCQIDIQAGFDDAVEVTFQVNQNVRKIEPVYWTNFIKYWDLMVYLMKISIDENHTKELELDLGEGTYHLYMDDFCTSVPIVIEQNPSQTTTVVECIYDGQDLIRKNTDSYPIGKITLQITNQHSTPITLNLAKANDHPWTSGAEVASNQSFRDLFSSELISNDETFSIRNMVFIFTDIKGSTALYERLGDSDAYFLVKQHFQILTEQVKKYGGAIVKTIGDAIMATFLVSTDAAEAVFAMQRAFDEFNSQEDIRDEIIIKVGIHRGPCIAVTSNDRLDYFGRTVNIAARVQGLSQGHDIMMSKSFYDEPIIKDIVDKNGWQAELFQANLKGIDALYDVVHLTS